MNVGNKFSFGCSVQIQILKITIHRLGIKSRKKLEKLTTVMNLFKQKSTMNKLTPLLSIYVPQLCKY